MIQQQQKARFLKITEYNSPVDGTPKVFVADIIRETEKYYVTRENVTFRIKGFSPTEHRDRIIYWKKDSKHRRGEPYAEFATTFKAEALMVLPPKSLRI